MTKVLVISGTGHALAELIRPVADGVEVRPIVDVLGGNTPAADVIVLHTLSPVRELAALATLPGPRPPVLIVAHAIVPGDVLTALRSGARSILVEGQYTRTDLLDAVIATAAGHSRLSPGPLSVVVDHVQSRPPEHGSGPFRQPLTQRELDIMELIAAGEPNAVIAERLALAEKTVRNRVSQIYLKLQVNNRTEAIVHWLSRTASR
ncbi:LuxR C-terminal-related transcriptional regulator [Dactylosporangium sp. CS-033363]|uniref:LuxR C-terminal-related transcriptional regulator n=1 Tax=Dactylosporangium sp. CS-033363 TaxID=3239935 RepID=UPI003D8E8787